MRKITEGVKEELPKRHVRGSVYSFIMGNYIVVALIAVALWLLVINFSQFLRGKAVELPDIKEFLDSVVVVKNDNYGALEIKKYMGENGYIEVLDGDANVIYCSDPEKKNVYTKRAVKFIPDVDVGSFYYIEKIKSESGQTEYLVSKFKSNDNDEYYNHLAGVAVLNSSRKVIYSDMDIGSEQFTAAEINILTGLDEDFVYSQKYVINLSDGSWRYLIMHIDAFSRYNDGRQEKITIFIYLIGIVLVIILMGIFAFKISRSVKKPLTILEGEMKEFSEKTMIESHDYIGPKEFVGVINAFDDMMLRLQRSENERMKMERDRQKMLMDISHDLRTPLTVILGYSKLIESGESSENDSREMASKIVKKANYMQELVENFFLFSKLESPQFKLDMKRGNICDFFREYIAGKYGELEDEGYELEFSIPEDAEIYAEFDEVQLQRSFENIIANSVRHNEKYTRIFASISFDEKNVIIRLGDNGRGIPKEIRKNIFEPFVTGDEARGGSGTGLGLSIVKKIVEEHGGTVKVLNNPVPEWTTLFEIIIPIVRGA